MNGNEWRWYFWNWYGRCTSTPLCIILLPAHQFHITCTDKPTSIRTWTESNDSAARLGMVTHCTGYVPSCHGWNFYAMSWCDALDIKVCVLVPGPFIVWTRIHSFHIYCRIKSDLQNVEMIHSIRIISHNCITFSIWLHSWHKTISKSLFRTETFRKLETYYLYLF